MTVSDGPERNIVNPLTPLRRCLALAQRERFCKPLKRQQNRFRTICTVFGLLPCTEVSGFTISLSLYRPSENLIQSKISPERTDTPCRK
ncbi:hypothetical protein BWD09_00280 [Neisseria dentiae]|uniref:Uncharacterized protein n=1 Tax=Neisseria dentiae TaxID=194197 RepID=A0A1X3DGB7_9NEIS|nr:hypothetical protein BWD09_00280 [Neisseria dentiae]